MPFGGARQNAVLLEGWFHPQAPGREHGVPLFPGAGDRQKNWCGRRESNPHGPFKPCGFSYRLRLSPPG